MRTVLFKVVWERCDSMISCPQPWALFKGVWHRLLSCCSSEIYSFSLLVDFLVYWYQEDIHFWVWPVNLWSQTWDLNPYLCESGALLTGRSEKWSVSSILFVKVKRKQVASLAPVLFIEMRMCGTYCFIKSFLHLWIYFSIPQISCGRGDRSTEV